MNNNYYILSLFAVLCVGCSVKKPKSAYYNFPIDDHVPKEFVYDTISACFYYENLIKSYIDLDAVVKTSGFIQADSISEIAYKKGYFIDGYYYANSLSHKGININIDKKSIALFYDTLFQKSLREGTNAETNINPFCGAYYKKFEMKIEVMFIDSIYQRVPLFIDCNQYKILQESNNRNNYQMMLLPTYAITKIFSWREL